MVDKIPLVFSQVLQSNFLSSPKLLVQLYSPTSEFEFTTSEIMQIIARIRPALIVDRYCWRWNAL